jgi:hypothetical protein
MKFRRLVLICSLTAGGFFLPVLTPAPSFASSKVPECSHAQLEVAAVSSSGAAAGSVGVPFLIANTGKSACSLRGYPTLSFFTLSGKPIKATVQHGRSQVFAGPKPVSVTIARNAVATFGMSYSDGFQVAKDTSACKVGYVNIGLPSIDPSHERSQAVLIFDMCRSNHQVSTTSIESGATPRVN